MRSHYASHQAAIASLGRVHKVAKCVRFLLAILRKTALHAKIGGYAIS
jgi:hypothetical protein